MPKTIPLSELSQLKRIMGMTTSTNDNEALVAMRKANAMLARHSLTWEDVLSRSVAPAAATYTNNSFGEPDIDRGVKPIAEQVSEAFEKLRGKNLGSYRQFIDDLEYDFKENGYLSVAQRMALMKTVQRNYR